MVLLAPMSGVFLLLAQAQGICRRSCSVTHLPCVSTLMHTIGVVIPRRKGLQLGRVFGIPISVGVSWLLVLFLYILYFNTPFHEVLGGSSTKAYLVTVITVLALFISIVIHEMGHALVAQRSGLQVLGIELWALGGVTRTVGASPTPASQLRVALAGPLATLCVMLVCSGALALFAPHQAIFDTTIGSGASTTALGVSLKVLVLLNAAVLALNLLPAFPLDGGQIAQALVWWKTGDRNRATRLTGRVGQAFALAIGALGLYLLAHGGGEGFWLLLVALVVYQGAGAAVAQGSIGQRLQRLTVADVMDREPITIPGESTLIDAREQFFGRYHWPWFAVVDPRRHFLGVLSRERVDAELAAGRPALTVKDALEEDMHVGIDVTQPLESLLSSEALTRLGGVVAVDSDGTLRGVVTLAQVRQALRSAS